MFLLYYDFFVLKILFFIHAKIFHVLLLRFLEVINAFDRIDYFLCNEKNIIIIIKQLHFFQCSEKFILFIP